MRQPDFFVVGAAKSGTTAIWNYFQQHPDIFVTKDIAQKELGYYSNQYGITDKDYYLSFFKNAKPNQIIGEVTHVYLSSEESAEWIKREVPNAKIIIMLRNPAERAYSLYNWMTMHGYEELSSFEKALKREKQILAGIFKNKKLNHTFLQNYLYLTSGLYYRQVQRYFNIFGKDNVKIIEYQDFKIKQEEVLDEIFNFLEVSNIKLEMNRKVNTSKRLISVKLQAFSRRILFSKYSKNKFLKIIFNTIIKYNVIQKKPKLMKKKTEIEIKKYYHEDVELLSKLCDFNFVSKWY